MMIAKSNPQPPAAASLPSVFVIRNSQFVIVGPCPYHETPAPSLFPARPCDSQPPALSLRAATRIMFIRRKTVHLITGDRLVHASFQGF